jgi:hypothetical protein
MTGQLKPIDKIADELFMHDLCKRIVKEFGLPAAYELCVLLVRYISQGLHDNASEERKADIRRIGEEIIKGLAKLAQHGDSQTRRAFNVAFNPPVDGSSNREETSSTPAASIARKE